MTVAAPIDTPAKITPFSMPRFSFRRSIHARQSYCTEADVVSLALACGAPIDEQHVVPDLEATLKPRCGVALR